MAARLERALVVIQPGLEGVLADELRTHGIDSQPTSGGALCTVDRGALRRIHIHARTPTRVWVRIGRFRAVTLDELARGTQALPWADYLRLHQPVRVRATTHRSRLRHRDRITRKVEHAIRDALRRPRAGPGPRDRTRRGPPPPEQGVLVRVEDDRVQISVDASGEPLYRRGWRQDIGEAPLRENLAAAVLQLAGWTFGEPLVDPMCGSGTFCIEAAQWAAGMPSGARRRFAFQHWPSYDAKRSEGSPPAPSGIAQVVVRGSDRDPAALDAARANARRARVGRLVRFDVRDVTELDPPDGRGLVVVNPPWGERIARAEQAYSALGETLRRRFGGWRVAILSPRPELSRLLRFPVESVARFPSGGIRISLCTGSVPDSLARA